MSWFPGTATTGGPSPRRKAAARSCCVAPAAVRQIAGRDDQLGLRLRHERADRLVERGVVARAEMEIREVQDARNHRRSRLYSE